MEDAIVIVSDPNAVTRHDLHPENIPNSVVANHFKINTSKLHGTEVPTLLNCQWTG